MSRDVDEARSGRGRVREHEFVAKTEANSHEVEAEAKIIALFFSAKFYISTPFSPKNEMFGRFSTTLQKFRLKRALTWELYW